jgi:DMSO reductase anchor subunit
VSASSGGPGSANGSGSATESPRASYHGQPILKAPVWSKEIPNYLFMGGLSGASATLAYAAELRGDHELGRRAWISSTAALMACPPLLIIDLGRPERFLNMLRMFKITSPMSMGSWILSLSGATTTVAGAHALTGRLAPGAAVARPLGAASGLLLSTYTAALFADTAVPAWHEARRALPFVFAAGAAVSAAGAASAVTPVADAAPARRLALGAAGAELVAIEIMKRTLGLPAETYKQGRAQLLGRVSRGCLVAGAGLLATAGSRRRVAAAVGGALVCAGALSTRWSVFEAGKASVADPRYVVESQRQRMADRVASGA